MLSYLKVCVICLVLFGQGTHGSFTTLAADISNLCCHYGTSYAVNHASGECSTASSSAVHSTHGSICVAAIHACCEEYFHTKKSVFSSFSATPTLPLPMYQLEDRIDETPKKRTRRRIDPSRPDSKYLIKTTSNTVQSVRIQSAEKGPENVTIEYTDEEIMSIFHKNGDGNFTKPNASFPEKLPTNITCSLGYRSINDTCQDVDECSDTKEICGPMKTCFNYPGGYNCTCPQGFEPEHDRDCKDVDECSLNKEALCSDHADCINTVGSYICQCHEGFGNAEINDEVCWDIDECTSGDNSSSAGVCEQLCINSWGSYECGCHEGYTLSPDKRSCDDVDECTEDATACVGGCVNEPGSYNCICPAGYQLSEDKINCIDIDECETEDEVCPGEDVLCLNIRGSFVCHQINCASDYVYNKVSDKSAECYLTCNSLDGYCNVLPKIYYHHLVTITSNITIPNDGLKLYAAYGFSPYTKPFNGRNPQIFVMETAYSSFFKLTTTDKEMTVSLVKPIIGSGYMQVNVIMTGRGIVRYSTVLHIYVSKYQF